MFLAYLFLSIIGHIIGQFRQIIILEKKLCIDELKALAVD